MKLIRRRILACAATFALLGTMAIAATDISKQVDLKQSGFARQRSTGLWAATVTVRNTSGKTIDGPIHVVLTNLSNTAKLVNGNGTYNGNPYITVSKDPMPANATLQVPVQFENPTNDFINFTMVAESGSLQ